MDSTLSISGNDPTALVTLSSALEAAFQGRGAHERQVVFACIGTDRSTGDALGPLVGQRLRRLGASADEVLGTLEEPLHALNLGDRLEPLMSSPSRPLIVAVDAALGSASNVGSIGLRPGGLHPGQGVGKTLPEVGELSITATVNVSAGALDAQVLQSTRLYFVQELAETIGTACWWGLRMARRSGAARARVAA
ncbi:MAG: spore protease YyaC [Actinobacteria bacterium]|nr:spore protease YyaC [Actinomycetota bacterium]